MLREIEDTVTENSLIEIFNTNIPQLFEIIITDNLGLVWKVTLSDRISKVYIQCKGNKLQIEVKRDFQLITDQTSNLNKHTSIKAELMLFCAGYIDDYIGGLRNPEIMTLAIRRDAMRKILLAKLPREIQLDCLVLI